MLASLALAVSIATAAPGQLPVQGRVLDSTGAPIQGPQDVHVALFDAATDGTLQWQDTLNITLADGYYSVVLGADDDLDMDLFAGSTPLWLQISIDGESLGRTPIRHVPRAAYAETAGHAQTAQSISSGTGVGLENSASATCAATTEGSLAYDFVRHQTVVCNGTDWQPLLREYGHIKVYMSDYQTIDNGSIVAFNTPSWVSGFTHQGHGVHLTAGENYRMISRVNTYNPTQSSGYLGYRFYFVPDDGTSPYPVGAMAYSQWPSGSGIYGFNAGLYEFYTPPRSGWLYVRVDDDHLAGDRITPNYNTYFIVEEI